MAVAMMMPMAASVAEGAMATWLSPQPGQICSGGKVEVAVGYNTGSNLKVTAVELYVDGQYYARKVLRTPEVRGVVSFAWDTTRVEQGTHNLVVKVYSDDQVISKVYGTGTVGPNAAGGGILDVRPPVVTFANIKAGDVVKGTRTIKMNAVDDSGKDPMVSLMVDESLKLLKNTRPYTYDLDSTTYADGDHTLKTFAYDAAGNRSDPAVIKVAFRNGDSAPAVTTLTVQPEVTVEPPPAKMTSATPPSIAAATSPTIKGSAARDAARLSGNSSAAPVVAVPEPKPAKVAVAAPKPAVKMASALKPEPKVAPAPAPVKLSAPQLSADPVKMASAAGSTNLRNAELTPGLKSGVSAEKPDVIAAPSASGVRSAGAARLPLARQTMMSAPAMAKGSQPAVPTVTPSPKPVVMASAKIAEPRPMVVPPAPKKAEPVRVASAPKPSGPAKMATASSLPATHGTKVATAPDHAVAAAPEIVGQPKSSSVKNLPVAQSAGVKSARLSKSSASDAVAAAPAISKTALKQVRVAMAPDFRTAAKGVQGNSTISRPSVSVKAVKARIEKTTVPAKGAVKARSFFNDLGGVLFWDPSTHTVTACVKGMVIEMQIGSRTAKVNGHDFTMDSAPYIVNGRTFMEARTYAQASNLLESLTKVGKAQID